MRTEPLAPTVLEHLRRLSTCVVASAIEGFRVRLPNTGFTDSSVRCMFEDRLPMVGYAATARIRSARPPMEGRGYYYYRTDWWNHILSLPAPRVVVIQDVDDTPGLGAFIGEVNANILLALGCVGLVTNGAVRDLNEVHLTRFQMFAGNVSVSHAYAHVFDFGGTLEVGGLKIQPGDLIHGDRHGVQTIPLGIAAQVPAAGQDILQHRRHLIGLCRSPDFSIEKLRAEFEEPLPGHGAPDQIRNPERGESK
jgi:4-hydroxy-4-methyl-2-oxoglutarate aldolase